MSASFGVTLKTGETAVLVLVGDGQPTGQATECAAELRAQTGSTESIRMCPLSDLGEIFLPL